MLKWNKHDVCLGWGKKYGYTSFYCVGLAQKFTSILHKILQKNPNEHYCVHWANPIQYFALLCFTDTAFFFLINKLKACSNPAYRRFFGDIFEIVFAHFMSLYHMLVILTMKVKVKVALSCPTLYDSKNYTVHKILQAKILECVAFPFSTGPSQLRDHIADRVFTSWTIGEAQGYWSG